MKLTAGRRHVATSLTCLLKGREREGGREDGKEREKEREIDGPSAYTAGD